MQIVKLTVVRSPPYLISMPSKAFIRPAEATDYAAIQNLLQRAVWPVRSEAGWRWAFKQSPSRQWLDQQLPSPSQIGWVIEDKGEIAGYLGNLPQRFWANNRWVSTATCTSYFVQDQVRSLSTNLMRAFFLQAGIEAAFSTTANDYSAAVYDLFKAQEMPDSGFRQTNLWMGNDRELFLHLLRKRGIPGAPICASLFGTVSRGFRQLTGWATPPKTIFDGEISLTSLEQIDETYDHFWDTIRAQPGAWLDRSAAAIRWQLSDPDNQGNLFLFSAKSQGKLLGYAIMLGYTRKANLMPRAYVLDFVVPNQADPAISAALLQALVKHAQSLKLVAIEAQCFSAENPLVRNRFGTHRRPILTGRHFIKFLNKALPEELGPNAVWPMGGLDGDFWFGLTGFNLPPAEQA